VKLELSPEESRELLMCVLDRLTEEAGLGDADRAAILRWRSESMTPGSESMRELTAKINADIDRALKTSEKSVIMKPDWR
jgi:hypothetical protein